MRIKIKNISGIKRLAKNFEQDELDVSSLSDHEKSLFLYTINYLFISENNDKYYWPFISERPLDGAELVETVEMLNKYGIIPILVITHSDEDIYVINNHINFTASIVDMVNVNVDNIVNFILGLGSDLLSKRTIPLIRDIFRYTPSDFIVPNFYPVFDVYMKNTVPKNITEELNKLSVRIATKQEEMISLIIENFTKELEKIKAESSYNSSEKLIDIIKYHNAISGIEKKFNCEIDFEDGRIIIRYNDKFSPRFIMLECATRNKIIFDIENLIKSLKRYKRSSRDKEAKEIVSNLLELLEKAREEIYLKKMEIINDGMIISEDKKWPHYLNSLGNLCFGDSQTNIKNTAKSIFSGAPMGNYKESINNLRRTLWLVHRVNNILNPFSTNCVYYSRPCKILSGASDLFIEFCLYMKNNKRNKVLERIIRESAVPQTFNETIDDIIKEVFREYDNNNIIIEEVVE